MANNNYYSVISGGDGWCVVDNITYDVVGTFALHQDALTRMEALNSQPYFKYNDERDALLFWH